MNVLRIIANSTGISYYISRSISTSAVNNGVRNFNKFRLLYRGTEAEKKKQKENPDRTDPNWSKGVRHPGYWIGNRFVLVPDCIPEIIVPDLSDCEFKPYVSYRAPDVTTEEFTAEDLFEAVYANKLEDDYKNNKLDEKGYPLEPSDDEKLTRLEAYNRARRTGSDYFQQDIPQPKDIQEHNYVHGQKLSPYVN